MEQKKLSTATSKEDGRFTLNYPKEYKGVAQLWMNGAYQVLLFLNKEDITLHWEDLTNREDLQTNSKEYDAFLAGMKTFQDSEAKLAGLNYLIPLYEKDSLKQQIFIQELDSVANAFPTYVKSLPENLFVRQYLLTKGLIEQMPKTVETYKWRAPAHVPEFMAIDFKALKHSGLYKEIIEGYTHLIERFPLEEINPLFEAAIDKVVSELQDEPEILNDIAQYWLPMLEKKSLFKASEYLTKAMLDKENTCHAKNLDLKIFEQHRKMAIGQTAPDIELKVESEKFESEKLKVASLYELQADQTLVVFWASWCPHCMKEMPKVNEWAKNNPNTTVVAVSLDDDKTAYAEATKNLENLNHSCDFKKWEGQAVTDYYIYGTPTFILLDKDKKIIGKYSSFDAVVSE